jgi:hypothetical protein
MVDKIEWLKSETPSLETYTKTVLLRGYLTRRI